MLRTWKLLPGPPCKSPPSWIGGSWQRRPCLLVLTHRQGEGAMALSCHCYSSLLPVKHCCCGVGQFSSEKKGHLDYPLRQEHVTRGSLIIFFLVLEMLAVFSSDMVADIVECNCSSICDAALRKVISSGVAPTPSSSEGRSFPFSRISHHLEPSGSHIFLDRSL